MSNNKQSNFITEQLLSSAIEAQTYEASVKFERRDFVNPLIKFCMDGNYSARLGIVYGLRSTGKTVGMLQAAEELMNIGHKVAYARFNYEMTGMSEVNDEIIRLAGDGFTHLFIDEAPYLDGFLTMSAEWADLFVPAHRIKIVISGTDSFELWLAMNRALYHRYVSFSTNRNTYPEYRRVLGMSFDEYKAGGGVFLTSTESAVTDLMPGSRSIGDMTIENFIENAVVDNLIHTLEHCATYTGCTNYYTDWLYAIDKQVIFKGIISILKSTVEAFIRKNFIKEAGRKNIPDLGVIISKWSNPEKADIKERIAESIGIYQNSVKISDPAGSIDALISFLVKTGCLLESTSGMSDLMNRQKSFYFAHNALMNYALDETKRGIMSIIDIDKNKFSSSLDQAAEGALVENIIYVHLLMVANKNEKVFRYRDPDTREIDAVIIDRQAKTLRLIEVKSKSKIDFCRVFSNEAKYLFDNAVLQNIGVDDSFTVTRVLVYSGDTGFALRQKDVLLLVNIEDLLIHYKSRESFLDQLSGKANAKHIEKSPQSMLEKLHEYANIAKEYRAVTQAEQTNEYLLRTDKKSQEPEI
jgi:predicted AAA+ superfamily ATPase